MYIETRFFDNGKVKAKLYKDGAPPDIETETTYNRYFDIIGNDGDYASIEEWIEEMMIDLDDIIPFLYALSDGKWVDISAYC